ncbi:teicoplanin resistance protein VanZ [Accumulibacter sp.]|uniref:teicoplanin resistance protein VanZ n=1 Tax=Accumulibacter sp. TaxID=2053492 RepID=UPI002D1FBBBB|nr:teicoplanin resistance protein VanZ [Accumulibacter sp.]
MSIAMFELSPARLPALRIAALLALPLLMPELFVGGALPATVELIRVPSGNVAYADFLAVSAVKTGLVGGLPCLPCAGPPLFAFAVALAIGVADELLEATLPHCQAGQDDLAADAAGTLVGAWAKARLSRAR